MPATISSMRTRGELRSHLAGLIEFYHPRCIDPAGGYFGFFRENGEVHDGQTKHLVGTTRAIINYAFAAREFGKAEYVDAIRHGIGFLRKAHLDQKTRGYAWILRGQAIADATNHAYGLAFVLLAYAKALQAGVSEVRPYIDETWALLEQHLWEPQHGLYADEASADWLVSDYRGQNANMHLCEAFIAAFESTGDAKFIERAGLLADNMVNRQAAQCGGQIWEHYHRDWQIDWDYNRHDRSNIFRPWGIQPGHQVEWAKLLLQLDRHAPEPWRLGRAIDLFTTAVERGWDAQSGGMIYGYEPNGAPCDCDKYSWVQIETMAAAALLHERSGDVRFAEWYAQLTDYCVRIFIDPRTQCWYRIRKADNSAWPEAAPFSCLTEYHTFSACTDIISAIR